MSAEDIRIRSSRFRQSDAMYDALIPPQRHVSATIRSEQYEHRYVFQGYFRFGELEYVRMYCRIVRYINSQVTPKTSKTSANTISHFISHRTLVRYALDTAGERICCWLFRRRSAAAFPSLLFANVPGSVSIVLLHLPFAQ